MSVQLALNLRSSSTHLPAQAGVRLMYLLVEMQALSAIGNRVPLHCCLLVDCSPSMRVPIADEAMFRELMRRGLAHEVILDGLAVWQLPAGIPPELQGRAVSPSRWLAQAVGSAAERLGREDRLSIIAFASRSRTLLYNHLPTDTPAINAALSKVEGSDFGPSTLLATALEQALSVAHEAQATNHTTRIILLTDGFVEDSARCLALADQFGGYGVPITTVGLGVEFQEQLLLALADQSGGHATMITSPQAIPPLLDRELERSGRILAQRGRLDIRLARGVELRRIYRVRPELADMPRPRLVEGTGSVTLGALERDTPVSVLLELQVPPHTPGDYRLVRTTLHADQSDGSPAQAAYAECVVRYAPAVAEGIDPQLAPILDRVAAFRMQTQALDAAAQGDAAGATRQLAAAVTRLIELGEHDLAARTAATAEHLEATGNIEAADAKALRYATRRLT